MKNNGKGTYTIPRITKTGQQKSDVPFEKYQHFVVAPAKPQDFVRTNTSVTNSSISLKEKEEVEIKSPEFVSPQESVVLKEEKNPVHATMTPFSVSISKEELDLYILEASNTSVHESTEKFINQHFGGETTVYWENVPELQLLYSPTYQAVVPRTESIASSAFFTKSIIRTNSPHNHPAFSKRVDIKFAPDDCPMMAFPLWDYRGELVAVVQIIRSMVSPEFTADEELFVNQFAIKFRTFSKFIINPPLHKQMLLDLVQLRPFNQLLKETINVLKDYFECRSAEIWKYEPQQNRISMFGSNIVLQPSEAGIVGSVCTSFMPLNCGTTFLHPAYNEKVDGPIDEPILVNPVRGTNVLVYVLRGPRTAMVFKTSDVTVFQKLTVFSSFSINNADRFTTMSEELIQSSDRSQGLSALLEVAEVLSRQLDIGKLTEAIMEKGRSLTKSDRCSLFLVNDKRDHLITSFQHGLANAICIPIDNGIAGRTVRERQTAFIDDAYADPDFDSSTDLETGYRTKNILSVPIINNRGEVIGVTEMVNKIGGKFTEWDAHMIKIFNVFCGISLENARLYQNSVEMSQQLHSFFDVSFSLSGSESIQRILGDIIKNARTTIDAECASILIIDEPANCLTAFLVDGGKIPSTLPLTTGLAAAAIKAREVIRCNNCYEDPRFNRTIDIENNFKSERLLVAPIISQAGTVLGAVEMVNKKHGDFDEDDEKLLKSFAAFAAVSLENQRLKSIAEIGSSAAELPKYMSDSERNKFTCPAKLTLTEDQKKMVSSLNFFSPDYKGVGHIKILFYLFNKFNLLEEFKIPNEVFFRFIYAIREKYNDVPYHNWMHCVDVCQYLAYEISTAELEKVFTPLEMLSLFVAAVCHDAGHEGLNNIYNVKAETPLGILFKDQSVMETHHCTVAISLLTREEYNLFHNVDLENQRALWTKIIQLILATDMANHFKLVKETSDIVENAEFDINKPEHRILAMKLLLKVGDISNVSRPFQIADKWCDILCEEFFRQGDNEKSLGIGLTSPLNDRLNSDKPKSQIGFYNFVCLPLYSVVGKIFPPLEVNHVSVKSNLEVWKELAGQNAQK